MVHRYTIGFFDPQAVTIKSELVVGRPMMENELQELAKEWAKAHGAGVDVQALFDPHLGVIVVPWLGGAADEEFAEAFAELAHRLIGAGVADVSHGEVLHLPRATNRLKVP